MRVLNFTKVGLFWRTVSIHPEVALLYDLIAHRYVFDWNSLAATTDTHGYTDYSGKWVSEFAFNKSGRLGEVVIFHPASAPLQVSNFKGQRTDRQTKLPEHARYVSGHEQWPADTIRCGVSE